MTETVEHIIAMEWALFDKVENIGGRAACQDDKHTFWNMRASQLTVWSTPMQLSYYQDLVQAEAENRNLLTEKYAYMMERTNPGEFAGIKQQLPKSDAEKDALIAEICDIHVAWQEALAGQYPHLLGQGRAIRKSADGAQGTSFETYLWGELKTYSLHTLGLYAAHVAQVRQGGGNLNEQVLQNTTAQYGYASIAAAQAQLADQGNGRIPRI